MELDLSVIGHRSPLGDWEMVAAFPGPPLAGMVSVLWDVRGVTHYAREAILPTGGVEILFSFGEEQRLIDRDDPARFTPYRRVWVSGLQQGPLVVESHGFSHLMGLRLSPAGAWRFFGIPLHEIANRVLDLDLILGRSLLQLHQHLGDHPDPDWRLRRLATFVARRMAAGPPLHAVVAEGLDLLSRSHGSLPIAAVLDSTRVSQRHLLRKFHEQVGLGPKQVAGLLRFRAALRRLRHEAALDLAGVAADCGYYDQAHFNRDFRRFAGASPREFLRRQLPDEVAVAMQA